MNNTLTIAATAWSLNDHKSGLQLAEQAEIAEALNYHSFWLPESHFNGTRSLPSPLMLLAAISSRTTNIKLATTSYLLPIRHPIQAAEEVAVLDQLSKGRVILGVGRGFQSSLFSVFDIDPKLKRKKFSSTLQQMIDAWSGAPIGQELSEDGSSKSIYLSPLPIQNPHPPIWVAAFGPLALKQAGTLGLPYLASPMETAQVLSENYRQHNEHLIAGGHQVLDTIPVMRTVFVSKDYRKIRQVREQVEKNALLSNPGRRKHVDKLDDWALIGDPDFVMSELENYRTKLGMTHLIASGRMADTTPQDYLSSLQLLAELHPQPSPT
ncbi:MAG: alkanesulfonate monooxygenase SsuD [Gammaproteobacteria bacterium]|jgi:alkanesulfonate monooxygenase SsuD/methylene tetrahydromethanopterin reductase-like flavin-dependent oxidoreductase (luciferase family)